MTDQPDPKPSAPPVPAAGPAAAGTATGHHINTDRPCARCGFNLFGQPIVREAHYGLIAARCPECGQLAALQEYPALGRWADRWARTLAALWVVLLIGAAGAQFGPTLGMMIAGVEIASEDFGQAIAVAFDASNQTGPGPPARPPGAAGGWTQIENHWWLTNREALIVSRGGLAGVIDRRFMWLLLPIGIGSMAAGIFWSVCLLGSRRRIAAIPAMLPLVAAFAIVWLGRDSTPTGNAATTYAHDIAVVSIRSIVLPLLGGAAALLLLLGVWQGRRVARVVVRLSLPPRMRSSLAILWTRDGLAAPATGVV